MRDYKPNQIDNATLPGPRVGKTPSSASGSLPTIDNPSLALAQKPWHPDYDLNNNKYLHWKDGKNNLRFNSDGKLVEHSGKVIGEPKGRELKILNQLMNAVPKFFSGPKSFLPMFYIEDSNMSHFYGIPTT